jgi:2-keto-4-pentenoate hydratase/2-oxohepta-3-ene-1,7-dioic acid hydratase in catechol pathway
MSKSITFNDQPITPSKVICIGRNYVEHIEELGNEMPEQMILFNKPNSAISDTLHYYHDTTRYETEICYLIQGDKIAGVGLGFDLTHAEIQNYLKSKGHPWERAKAFDGSAVLSEFIPLEVPIESLRFELYHNDTLQQHADYELMIYKPHEMLKQIGSFMSFEEGDIIMGGTPKGVSTYRVGDTLSAKLYSNDELLLSFEVVAQ